MLARPKSIIEIPTLERGRYFRCGRLPQTNESSPDLPSHLLVWEILYTRFK